jgi:hypothetical protein
MSSIPNHDLKLCQTIYPLKNYKSSTVKIRSWKKVTGSTSTKRGGPCCIILLYYIPYMWEWFEDKARKLA